MFFKKLPNGVYRGLPKNKPNIYNNEDPWAIKYSFGKYFIVVYSFVHGNWILLDRYSQNILGITQEEFQRVLTEKFNAKIKHFGDEFCGGYLAYFDNYNDTKVALEDFRPYYDSYYIPQAVMTRLSFYTEGGYPPYFKSMCDTQYDKLQKYNIDGDNNE